MQKTKQAARVKANRGRPALVSGKTKKTTIWLRRATYRKGRRLAAQLARNSSMSASLSDAIDIAIDQFE